MATINFNILSDNTSKAPKRAPKEMNDSNIENERFYESERAHKEKYL